MRPIPFPGYLILKPHTLNTKIGSFEMPREEDPETTPDFGEVLAIGEVIEKMPYDRSHLPKVGDVIAFKKYNHFKIAVGTREYIAVHFSNILFKLEGEQ